MKEILDFMKIAVGKGEELKGIRGRVVYGF